MKNNRIVRAYDSINPSADDKARMLENILAQADFGEKPEPPRKRKEPVVYTAKAAKSSKRSILGGLAACLAVFVIGGAVLLQLGKAPEGPAYADPTETVSPEKTAQDHYAPILEKYRRAAAEGWTKEQCEIEGISLRMQAGADFTKAGYAFLDLDADGREELLIAEESTDRTDNIWDIYTTLEDGTPIQLWVDELTGGQCRLCEGNVISISESYDDELEQIFYDLQAGQLVMREMLQWEDEDTVFHTDAEGSTRQVTSREGQSISYAYENQKLSLTWLAEIPDFLRDAEAVELYTPILEKYRTALAEGWDRIMCRENDMSMLTPIENEDESLYYAMYDLNSDGVKELIVSEYPYREDTDTGYIDIYTVYDGEAKNVMSMFELAGMRSLCEGGYVKDLFIEPGMEYDKYAGFWRLEADRFVTDFKVYQRDNQWFTEGYRGVGSAITREEADEIVASYPPLKLDFVEITASGEPEYHSGYEAFDYIIQKYVTAIENGWTEEQCQQNDISPQILDETTITHNLGWCLLDIDSNGAEELVISDGVHLFDLYVMMPHDGSPGHLISANGGESWQLCENNVIQNQGRYSGTAAWRHYTLKDTDIIQKDIVFYDGELNQYSYGADGGDLEPISKDKAGDLINGNRTMELDLNWFVPQTFDPDEVLQYQNLLELYQKALKEDWNPGVCMENGLSLMVAHRGEYYEDLGYALKDLNNDGIDELIITDGLNIYDLFTIIQDEKVAPLHLATAMERIEYFLTTDGLIYSMGSGSSSVSYYTLYTIGDRGLNLVEGYMMDYETSPDAPWYYYDGENRGDPCPSSEASAVMDAIVFQKIPFTLFQ